MQIQRNDAQWDFGVYAAAVESRIAQSGKEDLAGGIWRKDPRTWSQKPGTEEIADRLGWLHLPQSMEKQIGDINLFAEEIRGEAYRHAVLLGMGGSSLAPAVFQETFGNARGYPELIVLDSTHPAAIRDVRHRIDAAKTIFLVSSKSGTTLETQTLFSYFWQQVSECMSDPGRNFAAITDPGTPLAHSAKDKHFRRVFEAQPDLGGRYSALSVFGLVPAALIGVDIEQLLQGAQTMADACGSKVDPAKNPGILLGIALGELGISGRDKITFVTGAELSAFPTWVEQLIAESTGKNDKGLVPVAGERLGRPELYGNDRVFAVIGLQESNQAVQEKTDALKAAGFPVVRIDLNNLADLGQEFFLWEFAVAAAGSVLGIHPFDQPDVQLAKDLARKAMQSGDSSKQPGEILSIADKAGLSSAVLQLLRTSRPGDYIGLQAYLNPSHDTHAALERIRGVLRDRLQLATTLGYGPRFLHSTGQLHKGGPNTGVFLQFIDKPAEDFQIPGNQYTFGTLIRAQAEGDYQALKGRDRRIIRMNLGENTASALAEIESIIGSL